GLRLPSARRLASWRPQSSRAPGRPPAETLAADTPAPTAPPRPLRGPAVSPAALACLAARSRAARAPGRPETCAAGCGRRRTASHETYLCAGRTRAPLSTPSVLGGRPG